MRMSTVLSQLEKITAYIKDYTQTGSGFYRNTLDSFQKTLDYCDEISTCLRKVVDNVSVGEEAVDDPFNTLLPMPIGASDSDDLDYKLDLILAEVQSLGKRVDALEAFSMTYTKTESTNLTAIHVKSPHKLDSSKSFDISENLSTREQNSKNARKVISDYADVLRKMGTVDHGSVHVNQLTKLLWSWFQARFLNNRIYGSTFKYSPYRILRLLYAIIVVYGYHLQEGDSDTFVSIFYDWIDRLGKDAKTTNKYASPYEVYAVEQGHFKDYFNIPAMLLYSILWDLGLKELYNPESHHVAYYPTKFGIDRLLSQMEGSEAADTCKDYHTDPDVLYETGILSSGEVLK